MSRTFDKAREAFEWALQELPGNPERAFQIIQAATAAVEAAPFILLAEPDEAKP